LARLLESRACLAEIPFWGAKLGKEQNVTTTMRYVWKPAFAISYDISAIVRGGSQ
jgi:hypothetical protein